MNLDLLDPELAQALNSFPEIELWSDLQRARQLGLQLSKALLDELPMMDAVVTADHLAEEGGQSVHIRMYAPKRRSGLLPAMLWIHGGGYVIGNIYSDEFTLLKFAEQLNCLIVSVDYRLAPEHPYPIPLEDCYTALEWLARTADTWGVDPSRIAVGGISAGGGLAAALALLARDRGEIPLALQFLLCPMIDDRSITASSRAINDPRCWNRECNLQGWQAYLAGDTQSIYAAAARAKDLEGLPPAYIAVGGADLFVDENIEYAQRLIQAGVSTELHVIPGGFHAFEYIVPAARISRRARELHIAALQHAFERSSTEAAK